MNQFRSSLRRRLAGLVAHKGASATLARFAASSSNATVNPGHSKSIAEQNEERARLYQQKYSSHRDLPLKPPPHPLAPAPKKLIPEITGDVPDVGTIAARLEDEHGAHQVTTLDVRSKAPFADWLILCGGRTQRHVLAIADGIKDDMRQAGVRVGGEIVGICGKEDPEWMAVDIGAVVVHVMTDDARDRYDLEGLWTPDQAPGDDDADKLEN